jgi:sugar phosphate isomerase/epimerase
MTTTRRGFLGGSAAALAGAGLLGDLLAAEAAGPKLRISARHFGSNLETAKKAGMDGVEVGVGGPPNFSVADPKNREKIKDAMKATGLAVSSLSMDFLNGRPVQTEADAVSWLATCIEAAKDLGAPGILVPFFGKAGLLKGKELNKEAVDALVGKMKELAPKAKAAGVCLGLENTCSAKQNLTILDAIGSEAVACYYDIGNSTGGGYDVPAELRELKGRLCPCLHFKDGGSYLGEGRVKMEPVAEALKAIDYRGWIVLETGNPSKDAVADCKRNGDYIRKLMGIAG